jgi:pseudaminic acid cytidylyltransferase
MNEAVAIIPARGGSKRIPGKNIREFHGKPIIGYSIEAAQQSQCFARIVVSTDDDEIAAVARRFGAEAPFMRPASLADEHTGTMEVVKHAVETLEQSGAAFDWACCIYATAPFLSADHLNEGFLRLKRSGRSFAFAVTSFNYPIQRALRILPDGTLDAIWPEHRATRSQDLEPAYHDAGQFYWGRTSAFRERREVFSPESTPVVPPRERTHDIDTPEDWANAELAFAALRLAEGRRL